MFWEWLKKALRQDSPELAECRSNLGQIQKDIGYLNADIAELQIRLRLLQSAEAMLKAANSEKDSRISQFIREAKADRNTIDELQRKMELVQKTIKDLETQLANQPLPVPEPELTYENTPKWLYDKLKPVRDTQTSEYWPGFWWELEKQLWRLFALPEIKPYEWLNGQELSAKIQAVYNGSNPDLPALEIPELSDASYRVTTVENVRKIFLNSYLGLIPFIVELYDCDDFAREFQRHLSRYTLNSALQVWGDSAWGYHAYNLVICIDGLVMIEPQMVGKADQAAYYFRVLPDIIPGWIIKKIRDI